MTTLNFLPDTLEEIRGIDDELVNDHPVQVCIMNQDRQRSKQEHDQKGFTIYAQHIHDNQPVPNSDARTHDFLDNNNYSVLIFVNALSVFERDKLVNREARKLL